MNIFRASLRRVSDFVLISCEKAGSRKIRHSESRKSFFIWVQRVKKIKKVKIIIALISPQNPDIIKCYFINK